VTHHAVPDLDVAREAGRLLGRFHAAFADAPLVLPHARPPVHEPSRHFAALRAALDAHPGHRLRPAVAALAEAVLEAGARLSALPVAPRRLVHGAPKLSNLVFTPAGEGLCLVDLDTVAVGPLAPELGDAFRSWCNPGGEDGERGRFSLPIFEAALAGYAAEASAFLTGEET